MTMDRFEGKNVVVTGGAQGIGMATARRIGREGGHVFIADRAEKLATERCNQLKDEGINADVAIADMGSYRGACALMDSIIESAGRIDVLVNNVGGTIWVKPYVEYPEEEIIQEIEKSFYPTIWGCRAVLPHMIKQRSGAIVNLGSNSPRGIYRVPYAASKGGVFALTTSLALEVARHNVRVNCVAPGLTESDDKVIPRNPDTSPPSDEQLAWRVELGEFFMHQIPMQRAGRAEEQAAAIAFLASDDASFITGQILSVAGGATVP